MERIGLTVKVAENGAEGVQLFKSWHPHLIWMDRRMPVMDGIEATQRIRELPGGQEVKIVAVTAFMEQRDEMLQAGMDDFVRKPYRFNEIYECLSRQLGVQYTYAEPVRKYEPQNAKLTLKMLSILPEKLRQDLRDALESLKPERINEVILQVETYDAGLHNTPARLVDNFDYPAILKALQPN